MPSVTVRRGAAHRPAVLGQWPLAPPARSTPRMRDDPILRVEPLGFPWQTVDPFLFCVHHDDAYPARQRAARPGRVARRPRPRQDFEGKDGWRMYHGDVGARLPAAPAPRLRDRHDRAPRPHRSLRLARRRRALRPGRRAVADRRRAASCTREMFPLLDRGGRPTRSSCSRSGSTCPRADKMARAALHDAVERRHPARRRDATAPAARPRSRSSPARSATSTPPPPPPRSWAARPDADVAIWTIRHASPARRWTLPAGARGSRTARSTSSRQAPLRGRRAAVPAGPTGRRAARRRRVPARGRRRRAPSCCCCRAGRSASPSRSTARS